MKTKDFFRGLSWLVVLNLLVKPLWIFGIDRKVQNIVGHSSYGHYFSILSLAIVLSFIADAGLTNMHNRQIALGDHAIATRLVRMKFILSLLYLCVLFFICWLTGIHDWQLILFTGLLQVLTSFLVFFRNVITGHQLFRADAFISVIDKTLMIIFCGLLIYLPFQNGITLQRFLGIQLLATATALTIAVIIAFKNRPPIEANESLPVLRLMLPFIVLILLMSVHNRLDGFLLERIHTAGAVEAGVYAAAYRLLDAGNMVGYLAASFLVPFAARHLADREVLTSTVLKIRHGLAILAIPAVIVSCFFSKQITELLYHTGSAYYARVLFLCMTVLPAYYLVHIYGSLLTAKGLFRMFSTIMLVCVIVNAVLNILLIPIYGAVGCCVAALASNYLAAFFCTAGATRSIGLGINWRSVGYYLLYALIIAAICRGLERVIL